jgi:outer membrane receptor protein involved in Fe transport
MRGQSPIRLMSGAIALLLGALCVCLIPPFPAFAQVTTADIVGTVTDSTGAVVSNATVTATNLGTGEIKTTTVNQSGQFQFSLLQVGAYRVSVKGTGFKNYVTQVTLAAGDRARVDAMLPLGQATETVEVQATTPALQSDSSTIGTLITSEETQDLPLNGRNVLNLITTSAGVTGGLGNAMSSGTRPDDRRQGSNFSANGQSDENNNNLIDGMDNNERFIGSVGVRPSIDAIQEVRVLTNLYTAEISRTTGGVVDLITKSGTNHIHGSVYEYLRNDVLDARDYFARTGPKPELRQNQFGGSVGGPIVRNKAFFFFDYEGFRLVKGVTQTSTVPTAFEEANPGNFSDLGIGCPVVPASAIQTIGLNYFKLYPAPTSNPGVPGNCAPPTNNFTYTAGQTQFTTTYDAKVDYHFSNNDSAYARYTFNNANSFIPGTFPVVNGINPGAGPYGANFAGPATDQEQNGTLSYTHIFSPSLILDLKASYLRLNNQSNPVNAGKEVATQFGFPCNAGSCVNLPGDLISSGLPNISFSQPYGALGDADYVPLLDQNNTFEYAGSVSWLKGKHNIKFGAGVIRRQASDTQSAHPRGLINIQGNYTGNSLGDLLTDQTANVTRNYTVDTPAFRAWEDGFYVQDDWRVIPNLTLNLGVRYDIYTPFTTANGAFSNFDPSLGLLVGPTLPGAQKSGATAGVKTDYGDVAPRLGFAYTVRPGLVVRGGYGLTFFPGNSTSGAFMKNAPFTFSFGCGTTTSTSSGPCPAAFADPADGQGYLLSTGLPIPSTNMALATDPANYVGTTIQSTDPDYKNSFVHQYSLNAQRNFSGNVLTLAYVGNHGSRLVLNGTNVNQRPFAGASFPFPDLPNVTIDERRSVLWSNYNAFQATLERRLRSGLAGTVNYTWAHNLTNGQVLDEGQAVGNCVGPCHVDNGNGQAFVENSYYQYDYGNADIDTRHRITVSMTYQLPFGATASGFRSQLEKGWSVNSIYYWQTGNPFTVQNSNGNQSGIGLGNDRPNMVPSSQFGFHKSLNQWFDVSRFKLQGPGLLGNESRNSLYGPGTQALAFSTFKSFPIREAIGLQFRAEAFNLFNTPTFNSPNSTITSYSATGIGVPNVSAGQISSTAPLATPRQIQFALKLLF